MIRRVAWLLLALWWPSLAFADHQFAQVYVSGENTPSATAARYNVLHGGGAWDATENNRKALMGAAGTLTNFRVTLASAAGAGKSLVISVRVNGATSALSCTFNDGTTVACLDTSLVTVAAGDEVNVLATPASTPTVSTVTYACDFLPTTAGLNSYGGGAFSTNLSSVVTEYLAPQAPDTVGTTEFSQSMLMPFAGTIEALYVELSAAPDLGAGVQSRTFTVRVNNTTNSDCIVTISEAGLTGNDVTCSTTFVAGDYLSIASEVALAPTAALAWTGLAIQPDQVGQFALGLSPSELDVTNEMFNRVNVGSKSSWQVTNRNNRHQETNSFVGQALYVLLSGAPDNGAGTQSYTITLEDNEVDTALTVTVSEASVSNNITGLNVQFSGDDLLTYDSDPVGTPTVRNAMVSVLCFNSPRRGVLIQ